MRRSSILVTLLGASSCLPAPAPPAADAASGVPAVTVLDAAGDVQSLAACSRRPRIRVSGLPPDLPENERPLVFLGEPTETLIEDARRSPWTVASIARAAPAHAATIPDGLELVLERPLAPAASVWVVVPGFLVPDAVLSEPLVVRLDVASEGAGAVLVETFPPDGTIDLGAGLRAIDLAFDDAITGDGSIELRDEGGLLVPTTVRAVDCASTGLVGSQCVRMELAASLAVETGYELDGSAIRDRHGDAPCPAHLRFRTTIDEPAPIPVAIPCAVDERAIDLGCLLERDDRITLRSRFAHLARIALTVGDRTCVTITRSLESELVLGALPTDAPLVARVLIESSSGAALEVAFDARTTARLPDVVVGEVRADALGPEPAQEYVELWNLGDAPIDLGGFRLADGPERDGDALPSPLVVPRYGVVLVVADSFELASGPDVAPPPGAMLARVGASIGSAGLSNAGEPIFLRDAAGHRVAEMPAVASPRAGTCVARAEDPYAHGDLGRYAASIVGCTPGTR